jgi:hypothetical protein
VRDRRRVDLRDECVFGRHRHALQYLPLAQRHEQLVVGQTRKFERPDRVDAGAQEVERCARVLREAYRSNGVDHEVIV